MAPPTGQIPAPLPPSVEEAYRRKCIQLKQRLNEIDEGNDLKRLRLDRLKREINKDRLERAFLLEQLAKRTSTNVEDSEGSPSPPPTPKEKPLRTKRGHRKPSFLTNLNDPRHFPIVHSAQTHALSPSNSDTFSHGAGQKASISKTSSSAMNGSSTAKHPKRPKNGFELFVKEKRDGISAQNREEGANDIVNVDEELARTWQGLGPDGQEPYLRRFQNGDLGDQAISQSNTLKEESKDEDTEMGENDTNDAEDTVED